MEMRYTEESGRYFLLTTQVYPLGRSKDYEERTFKLQKIKDSL